jgi:hypothetical protein
MPVVAPPVRMFVRAAQTMAACLTQPAIRRIRNQRVPAEGTACGAAIGRRQSAAGSRHNKFDGQPIPADRRSASHVVQSVESLPTDYWHFQREIPAIGGAGYSAASRPATESTWPVAGRSIRLILISCRRSCSLRGRANPIKKQPLANGVDARDLLTCRRNPPTGVLFVGQRRTFQPIRSCHPQKGFT